jgi:WW domain-binding protein 11
MAASTGSLRASTQATVDAATVSAAPQLRDFKKEATSFIPTSVKRKKAGATSSSFRINAAPSLGEPGSVDADSEPTASRPDLLNALKDQFGPAPTAGGHAASGKGASKDGATKDKKDDYAKFVEEMGDILGPVL